WARRPWPVPPRRARTTARRPARLRGTAWPARSSPRPDSTRTGSARRPATGSAGRRPGRRTACSDTTGGQRPDSRRFRPGTTCSPARWLNLASPPRPRPVRDPLATVLGKRLGTGQRGFLTGTLWVAAGTTVLGVSGYGFLALSAHLVSPVDYASLSSLYLLVALIGPGLFLPVEQETTRLVSRARALGVGERQQTRQIARLSAALLGAALLVLAALGPLLVHRVFHGNVGLWFALVGSVAGYGGVSVLRG